MDILPRVQKRLLPLYKVCALPFIVFTILLLAWFQGGVWYSSLLIDGKQDAAREAARSHGNALYRALSERVFLLNELVNFTHHHLEMGDLAETFGAFSAGIYGEHSGIQVFLVHFKDGSDLVYPAFGNPQGLGASLISLLQQDMQSKQLDPASFSDLRSPYLVGPYQTLPDHWEMAAFQPLFHQGEIAATAVVVYSLSAAINEAGFGEPDAYLFAVKDQQGQLLHGEERVWQADPVTYSFDILGSSWELAASPAAGWKGVVQRDWLIFQTGGLILVAVLTLLALNINHSMVRLKAAVERSTRDLQLELLEKQKTLTALRESEEKFRSLAENSQDYIERYDRQGRHLYANPAIYALTGKTEAEIVGKTHREVSFDAQHADMWEEKIQEVFSTGQTVRTEFALLGHNSKIDLEWVVSPEFDERGNVVSALGVSRDVTHRKQIENALLESEERFRMLFEQAPLAYQSLDADGRLIEVNQAWLKLLGYSRAEVLDREITEFMAPASGAAFRQHFLLFKERGSIESLELELLTRDGSSVLVAVDGRIGKTISGEFKQTHCILNNITERKKNEAALRENEARLRLALQAANQGLYDINLITGQFLINPDYPPAVEAFDKFPTTVIQWARRIHPEDRRLVLGAYHEYFNGQRDDHRVHFRYKTQDGKWVWILAHGKFVEWDETGRPIRMLGTLIDITRMKRVEAELRESERRFRLAQSLAHLGHWHRGLDSTDIYCSEELFSIYGVEPEAGGVIQLDKFFQFVHPEDRSLFISKRQEVLRDGHAHLEYRFLRPDGTLRYLSGVNMLEYDEHRVACGYFGVVLDITEIKQKERELAIKNAEIETFTYTISHDLKSPLVTIQTFMGYLEKDIAAGSLERIEQDKYYIWVAADKMGRLLDEILQFSRLGRHQSPAVRVPYQEIVSEALSLVAGAIARKNVEVVQQRCDLTLFADPPRLVQIWQNLIDNAVKFIGEQEAPRIEIGIKGGEAPIFYVADNGKGIDPAFSEKIFALFEKLDVASEGVGMGLALTRRIVELYQGKIWAESAGVGKGTCICFTLPGAFQQLDNER